MYETLSQIAQTWGLVAFVIAFILVLIYALSPANREKFERARRLPLEDGDALNGEEDRG